MATTTSRNGHGPAVEQNPSGPLVVTPRHVLSKQAVRRASGDSLFDEIGTTGLRQYGGFVVEEWLTQLASRRAAWVWREMQDNDPIVGAILFALKWLARGVDYRVESGGSTEYAEFVESCMHDMSHTWGDVISEALSMLPYGWAYHEIVYKLRRGPQPDRPILDPEDAGYGYSLTPETRTGGAAADTREDDSQPGSSEYKDGRIGWRKLPIRAQETHLRWGFHGYSGISGMWQIDWHGGNHFIPIEKALLFRTQTTRNNPEGRSILRNAYTSYYSIKNIKTVEAIGIERDLAGIPVVTPPPGVDIFSPANADLLAQVQQMVTSIRRDEYEGVILPTADWKLQLLSSGGSRQIDTDQIIRRYRQDIAVSMLAEFVLIGMDNVGSYAMVDVKSDLFGIAIDSVLDLLCEVFNRYAIPRLLKLNGMDVTKAPKIKHGSAGRIDLEKVGMFLNNLFLAGAPIPWSTELIRALFLAAGLPANFETSNTPILPVNPNPTQGAPTGPGADRQPGQRPAADVIKPAAQRTGVAKAAGSTGAMIALYPPSELAGRVAIPDGETPEQLHVTLAYLGRADELTNPDQLAQIVAAWAAATPPLEGRITGLSLFTPSPNSDGEIVTNAGVQVHRLHEHRDRLASTLIGAGQPLARDFPFTPHLCLAYGDRRDVSLPNEPVRFDSVALVLAAERRDFPLAGVKIAKAASLAEVFAQADGGYGDMWINDALKKIVISFGDWEGDLAAAAREMAEAEYPGYDIDSETEQGDPGNRRVYDPAIKDIRTVKVPGWRAVFQRGKAAGKRVAKAQRERLDDGSEVVHVAPILRDRQNLLSAHLEREIGALLSELGTTAASAYLTHAGHVEKAQTRLQEIQRLVARVMKTLNLRQWVQARLRGVLVNHAGRVAADTVRTLQAEVGLEMEVAEDDVLDIARQAGRDLRVSDIEPQVRAAIMQAIRAGFAAGDNPEKIAGRIRSLVPAGRFVHAGSPYRARLIAREETAAAQRASILAAYRTNPNITAVQLRDGIYGPPRSDTECMDRDGERVPIDDVESVAPYHPLCTISYNAVVSAPERRLSHVSPAAPSLSS